MEEAWAASTGAGITIAIIDDGFDLAHPEFAAPGKIAAPRDVTKRSDNPAPGERDHHGTACAGVACASGVGTPGASGVAPDARLMPIRLASALGSIEEAEAFYHAADQGADIISCSWGPQDGKWWVKADPLHQARTPLPDSTRLALDYCIKHGRGGKGCVITWAAGNGNESADLDGYAAYDKVIAIAACNDQGVKSDYSDFGKCVWCAFPSNQSGGSGTPGIWTVDRVGRSGYNPGLGELGDVQGSYTNDFGGTSSACPGAAGIAALVLSAHPALTWDQVRQLLADTADKIDRAGGAYDAKGRSTKYGHGRLNARRAVEQAIKMGGRPRGAKDVFPAVPAYVASSPGHTGPSAEPGEAFLKCLELQQQHARNLATLMTSMGWRQEPFSARARSRPEGSLALVGATRAAQNVAATVIAVLRDMTDAPFGRDTSLSRDLYIDTNGRWDALAGNIRDELPAFRLSGRQLRAKMGPPPDDTVGKLIGVVEAETSQDIHAR